MSTLLVIRFIIITNYYYLVLIYLSITSYLWTQDHLYQVESDPGSLKAFKTILY